MDRKTLLEKGYTEDQVTELLNMFHGENSNAQSELAKVQQELEAANKKVVDFDAMKKRLDDIDKEKLTREEKIALQEKEAADKVAQANKLLNSTKAKSVLVEAGITDNIDSIVSRITTDDENATMESAKAIADLFKAKIEETAKKTREEIANLDIKPNPSNVPQDGGAMTWDKFTSLSQEEQSKFQQEHPEEFLNL